MVTEEDRRFAREYAPKIAEHMRKRPYGAINHMATEISLEEAIRRGLLTECAYAHVFGGEPCVELLPNGDGGRDFWIYLRVGFIPWRFKVNVKTKSVQVSLAGLIRSGTHLRVPITECQPRTIYVLGAYHERTDDAEILKWDWGRALIDGDERMMFENSKGDESYVRKYEELRDLSELKNRVVSLRHFKLFGKK